MQCRQSLCLLHLNDGMCQILASQSVKRRDADEGLCQIFNASSRTFGTNRIHEQRIFKNEGTWMKSQAKILRPDHEKYHICEQRIVWRGYTFVQSRQSLCKSH